MLTNDKVTELFCMADEFCKFFGGNDSKIYSKEGKEACLSLGFYDVENRNHAHHAIVPGFRLSLSETFLSGKSLQTFAPSFSKGSLDLSFTQYATKRENCSILG